MFSAAKIPLEAALMHSYLERYTKYEPAEVRGVAVVEGSTEGSRSAKKKNVWREIVLKKGTVRFSFLPLRSLYTEDVLR